MTKRNYFGTDGIRGKANIYPMTGEVAMKLGRVVTYYFQKLNNSIKKPVIILGKDTRRSCYMLEQAFAAGVCSQGGSVILTGPLPTPGVSFVTKSMRADAGVMISASHNPYYDNGIKIFNGNGEKLSDKIELELERLMNHPELVEVKINEELGNAKRLDEVFGRYIVQAKSAFSSDFDLSGMRVVVDCANGAAYKVAPMVLRELGADVITIGVEPNGININDGVGALYPQRAQKLVLKYRADLGICLDGDSDRLVIVLKNGEILDGDVLIGIFTKLLFEKGEIKKNDTIVGTIMSNLGLENYVKSLGLKFIRTKVGDRYISEDMKKTNSILGGEPSGHVIFKNHSLTGDGIISALKFIEATKFFKNIDKVIDQISLCPQVLLNLNVKKKIPFEELSLFSKKLKSFEKELGTTGRILVRYSGTENLARVMVEGEDEKLINDIADALIDILKKELS